MQLLFCSLKIKGKQLLSFLKPAIAVITCISMTACTTSFTDISPDNKGEPVTGGQTIALAGRDTSLFAVSLNAGVWNGRRTESGVRRWTQAQGPRYTECIAVDDAHPTHIIVGDREGDAKEIKLNEAGLWESFDGGSSYTYAWNPMEAPATNPATKSLCQSQIIEAVVFTSTSAVVAATPCGIARRENGSSDFNQSIIPDGIGKISNLVAGQQKIWARTMEGLLLVSTDDGKHFTNATTKPIPAGLDFSQIRGDAYSLAGSDTKVIMSGCCSVFGPAPVKGHPANELIIYNVATDSWSEESFIDGAGATSAEGTYLGGRRFVRSFLTSSGYRYFYCSGQHVWESDLAGTHTLTATSGVDNPGIPPTVYKGSLHNDFWDFALDKSGFVMWVACDGGIYENRSDLHGWLPAMQGYHTQAVQSLDIFYDPDQTQVIYATQDNAAWSGKWPDWVKNFVANTADVNVTDGDPGSEKLGFLSQSRASFMLISLNGGTTPSFSSDVLPGAIYADPHQPDTPGIIQFIKGTKAEAGTPLDAVMIVHRPVKDNTDPMKTSGTPIVPPAALSGIEQMGNPWLLRNRKFAEEPDFYRAVSNGNWEKELDDLPVGTYRVLVSGGHETPHYFAIVQNGPGTSALWERKLIRTLKKDVWTRVFDGIIPLIWNPCYPWEGWYGPVFVNPYDASKIYLLTADAVKVSHRDEQGNLVFKNDDILTMLISASETYPLRRQLCTGNTDNVLVAQRLLGETTLGTVSFCRDDPGRTLVSSPVAGVFYDDGSGKWRSFNNVLPQGGVWAAKMDGDKAYIGFAGRSVGMVDNIGKAALATYFTRMTGFIPHLGGGQAIIAQLHISDGNLASNAQVSCRITGADGTTKFWGPTLTIDNQGRVLVPFRPPAGSIVHLHFTGSESDGIASCEYHYSN